MANIIAETLAQTRPAGQENAYQPAAGKRGIIQTVTVCNTTNTKVKYSLFKDLDGTTYDDDSVLVKEKELPAYSSDLYTDVRWPVTTAGSFGVENHTASACNFTIDGYEEG